jgi:hypothetical protein
LMAQISLGNENAAVVALDGSQAEHNVSEDASNAAGKSEEKIILKSTISDSN